VQPQTRNTTPARIPTLAPVRRAPQRGFSLPELLIAMTITVTLMTIVFAAMRQNQDIFETESGVTAMNENVRAAVDLVTREVQAAGTGLRGMTAPILGVDGDGDASDRLAVLIGDPYAPIGTVRANAPGTNGVDSVAVTLPAVYVGQMSYRDDRRKEQPLFEPGDRYVLYNGSQFRVVRVTGASRAGDSEVLVRFRTDPSNPKPKFGNYDYVHAVDGGGARLARLDTIVYYRWDQEKETLERRENHEPFAAVARGIKGFQVRYRVGEDAEPLSEPLDEPPTERTSIRSVVVTLRARTPDHEPDSPYYRETSERVEITPRNMRLMQSGDGGS
jgi:prepilin-type N-terminal cleavage/methylation domain-containing protein